MKLIKSQKTTNKDYDLRILFKAVNEIIKWINKKDKAEQNEFFIGGTEEN